MSDINATARVQLDVNGKPAEDQLARLKERAEDLKDAIAKAAKEGNEVSLKQWQRELRSVQKEMRNIQSSTQNVNDVMKRLDSATPKELKQSLRQLERQLQNISRGSKAWDEQTEKIKRVKTALAQVNSEVAVSEGRWAKLNRLFNDWGNSILAAVGALTGLVLTGRKAVESYAEMEQEMANVRKFTGMTAEEVADLNEEFKKMDTRTSREELNQLAQEAGRLGKTSKEDVLGFVRAADKINVALDDLGDGATLTLSKLTGIFGDEARLGTEKSLLAVGSVINELSQNCSASAPYLAEFSSRLGGVGSQAHMTIQQIMGIGAVLDTQNQKVEASATAISQVITRLYQEPAKYAKTAGLDVKQFTDLLKKDANEALLTLLEALNKAGGLDKLSPMFSAMGENGSRAISALSALAGHINEVREQQLVANQAFEEATSVGKEYDVQNNTVQASLDKAKKKFKELTVELGEKLIPVMRHAISGTSTLVRGLSALVSFVLEYRVELMELVVAIAAYNIAMNAAVVKTKLYAAWTAICKAGSYAWMVAMQALNVVTALFSSNTHRLGQEFKLLSAMLKTNPWGLVIAGVSAVVVAMTSLIRKTVEATKAEYERQKAEQERIAGMRDISEKVAEYSDKEINALKYLYETANNEAKSKEARMAAANKILKQYPEYFKGISAEQLMIGGATAQYNALTKAILDNAMARAAAEKIHENMKKIVDLQMKMFQSEKLLKDQTKRLKKTQENYDTGRYQSLSMYRYAVGDKSAAQQTKQGLKNFDSTKLEAEKRLVKETKEQIEQYKTDIKDLEEANAWLQKTYKVTDELMSESFTSAPSGPSIIYTAPGKIETKEERKAREKAEREAARDRKKAEQAAKKALKDELKEEKRIYEEADRENLARYNNEEITHEEYLEKKYANELSFLQAQMQVLYKKGLRETEEYAALAKKEEEIKSESLNRITKYRFSVLKSEYDKETAANKQAAYSGEIDYQEYITAQELIDTRYINSRMKLLEDAHLQETSEYSSLLREKEDLTEAHLNRVQKLESLVMEKAHATEMSLIRFRYNDMSSDIFMNQKAMEKLLLEEDLRYLKERQQLYIKGADEWIRLQGEIDEKLNADRLQKQEALASALLLYSKQYSKRERDQRMADEIAILEQLKKMGLVTEVEYQEALKAIRAKYREEEKQTNKDKWDQAREDVQKAGSEMGDIMFKLATSFDRLFSNTKGVDFWENLADAAQAAYAIMKAGISNFSSYFNAEKDAEIAKVNQAYDEEIARAGKRTKVVARLEEEKERKVAELKNKYNERAMKMEIAQAVAESATNAILGYQAGLKFPFPANVVMPAILAGMAVAQGAIQIATIQKQHDAQAQGYAEGGFTPTGRPDEPVGVVHAGEWVASNKLVKSPVVRPLLNALEWAQRNNTIGVLGDVSGASRQPILAQHEPDDDLVSSSASIQALYSLIAKNAKVMKSLEDRLSEPILVQNSVTGQYGYKRAEDNYKKMIRNKSGKKF